MGIFQAYGKNLSLEQRKLTEHLNTLMQKALLRDKILFKLPREKRLYLKKETPLDYHQISQ